jgi:peptidoglycan/LPS O-acetylase OafA/YrhL
MQFYLAFPFMLTLLRRTRGYHGHVIAVTVLAQVAIGMHWNLFPREMVRFGQQDVISYPLYLVSGCVAAFHIDQVHAWVCAHARLIVAMTVAAALAAEGIYFLAANGVTTVHRAHPGALVAAEVLRCTSRRAGERSRPSHAPRSLGC